MNKLEKFILPILLIGILALVIGVMVVTIHHLNYCPIIRIPIEYNRIPLRKEDVLQLHNLTATPK